MADIKNKINIDDIYGVTAKVGPVDIRAEQKVKNLKPEGQPTFSVGTGFYEEGVPVDIGLRKQDNNKSASVKVRGKEFVVGQNNGVNYKSLFIPLNIMGKNVGVSAGTGTRKTNENKTFTDRNVKEIMGRNIKSVEDRLGVQLNNFNFDYSKLREAMTETYSVPKFGIEDSRTNKFKSHSYRMGFTIENMFGGTLYGSLSQVNSKGQKINKVIDLQFRLPFHPANKKRTSVKTPVKTSVKKNETYNY